MREGIISHLSTNKNGQYNSEYNITPLLIVLNSVWLVLVELRVISPSSLAVSVIS